VGPDVDLSDSLADSLTDGPGADLPPDWWNTAWSRRRRITFDNTQHGALQDVPVLIVLRGGRIDYARTRPQGADIRFIDADGTPLSYEIERWDTTGDSFVWVKVPQIDGGSATDHIWLYHDNPGASDAQQPTLVWNAGYQAVWHLNDGFQDSTLHGNHATNVGSTDAAGAVGRGRQFDGNNQYVDANYTQNLPIYTVSAWIRGAAAPVAKAGPTDAINGALMREENYQLTWDHHDSYFRGAASLKTTGDDWKATPFATLKGKTWYHLAATYDGYALDAYTDGQLATSVAAKPAPVSLTHSAKIGRHAFRTDIHPFLHGMVDEVRICSVVRSADWIAVQHQSMTDTLASFGGEERWP